MGNLSTKQTLGGILAIAGVAVWLIGHQFYIGVALMLVGAFLAPGDSS